MKNKKMTAGAGVAVRIDHIHIEIDTRTKMATLSYGGVRRPMDYSSMDGDVINFVIDPDVSQSITAELFLTK